VKHILVTGAAGAIGGAIAAAFRKQDPGARFSLVDVNDEATAREARRVGGDAAPYNWDLSKVDALPALYAALEDERGPVDVLVNCAGIMEVRSLVATPWELGAKLMRIDLESPLRLMSLAAPGMVRRGHGTIVNVTSMAGVTPLRGCTSPSSTVSTKAGACAVIRPRSSTIAVRPVLVARTSGRAASSARICAICRCWCGAVESPNHASLLTFTSAFASRSTASCSTAYASS